MSGNPDEKLPAVYQPQDLQVTTPEAPPSSGVLSIVKSAFGFQLQRKTLTREAERNRAASDVIDSRSELTKSAVSYQRALSEWDDVDNIVKDDQRGRDHQRWQTGRDQELIRAQAEHQDKVQVFNAAAELEAAQAAALLAERRRKAIERNADNEIDLWVNTAETEALKARAKRDEFEDAIAARKAQLHTSKPKTKPDESGLIDAIAILEKQLEDLIASGASIEVVGELVRLIAGMRASRSP